MLKTELAKLTHQERQNLQSLEKAERRAKARKQEAFSRWRKAMRGFKYSRHEGKCNRDWWRADEAYCRTRHARIEYAVELMSRSRARTKSEPIRYRPFEGELMMLRFSPAMVRPAPICMITAD